MADENGNQAKNAQLENATPDSDRLSVLSVTNTSSNATQDKPLNTRSFLRFAGVSVLVGLLDKFLGSSARAQTWQKVGNPTGAAGIGKGSRPLPI